MTTLRQIKQELHGDNARENKRVAQLELDVKALREEVAVMARILDAMTEPEETEEVTVLAPKTDKSAELSPEEFKEKLADVRKTTPVAKKSTK